MALAALPVLIGLVLGGYVNRFSFAGVEVEAPPLKPVEYVAPGGTRVSRKEAASINADWTSAREEEYERNRRLLWCIYTSHLNAEARNMTFLSS